MIDDGKRRRAGLATDYAKSERIEFLLAEVRRGVPSNPIYGQSADEEPCELSDRHSPRKTQKPRL